MGNLSNTPIKILRRKEVEAKLGIKRSCLYGKLKHNPKRPSTFDPTFPRPIRIGSKAVGWVEADLDDWLRSKREQSTGNA